MNEKRQKINSLGKFQEELKAIKNDPHMSDRDRVNAYIEMNKSVAKLNKTINPQPKKL